MKLFDNGQGPGNTYEAGMWYYQLPIGEFGDRIYINGQGHTKTDLKPIFNDFYFSTSYHNALQLHNRVGFSGLTQGTANFHKSSTDTGVWYNGTANQCYTISNRNGQVDAVALTDQKGWETKEVWESADGYLYYLEYNRNDGEIMTKVDRKTMKKALAVGIPSAAWSNFRFFHEDDDYIYGFNHCANSYSGYSGCSYTNKETLITTRWGLHNRHSYGAQPIYKNDDYILNVWFMFNYSSSRPGISVQKLHFNDVKTSTASQYLRSAGSNVNYASLPYDQPNGSSGYDPYTHPFVYWNMTLSDDLQFKPKSYYNNSLIGIVNDATLRKTHNIARFYVAYIQDATVDEAEPLKILRANVPIGDSVDNVYSYDIRHCNITVKSGVDATKYPSYANSDGHDTGSSSYAYRSNQLQYFESNGNSYLLHTWSELGGLYMNDTPDITPNFYVYKILNHGSSLTADIHETNSLDLEIVQIETNAEGSCGIFFPGGHVGGFTKFVYVDNSMNVNPIFEWNSSTEKFESSHGLNGPIVEIGEDSQGRIFSAQWPNNSEEMSREIHLDSLELTRKVVVTPEKSHYDFQGSDINSYVNVTAFDATGTQVAVNIKLDIVGTGVSFDGATSKTITTETSQQKQVNIKITSASRIQITATIL